MHITPKKHKRLLKTKPKKRTIHLARKDRDQKMQINYNIPQFDGTKIALIQTGSWGDCVNSTLMFKPLKAKFPNSIIDVFTSSLYQSAFHNNPFIHKLIVTEADTTQAALHQMITYKPIVDTMGYDLVFNPHPMINPGNWTSIKNPQLGTNLICAWVRALEHADIPYTLPRETILRLTDEEFRAAENYCGNVNMNKRNIIQELEGKSGQTFWNENWTLKVGRYLLKNNDTNLFLSRKTPHDDTNQLASEFPGHVHFVGKLSIRVCAEIFNRCHAFLSISSGLSNAVNTNWCKKDIKWFECVNSPEVTSAPIRREGKIFWHTNDIDKYITMLSQNGI